MGNEPDRWSWWTSRNAPELLFRYEGRNGDAYIFSKFSGGSPDDPGDLLGTVEVYNLEALEPVTA